MIRVARQIEEELEDRLVMPTSALLGVDLGDEVRHRLLAESLRLAAEICGDDPALAGETVSDLLSVLWPDGVTDPTWWHTPLGRACARSVEGGEAVSFSRAAAILGVTKGTVAQLVARGRLVRARDGGGVQLASVLERMLQRHQAGEP